MVSCAMPTPHALNTTQSCHPKSDWMPHFPSTQQAPPQPLPTAFQAHPRVQALGGRRRPLLAAPLGCVFWRAHVSGCAPPTQKESIRWLRLLFSLPGALAMPDRHSLVSHGSLSIGESFKDISNYSSSPLICGFAFCGFSYPRSNSV